MGKHDRGGIRSRKIAAELREYAEDLWPGIKTTDVANLTNGAGYLQKDTDGMYYLVCVIPQSERQEDP